jgi:hypothetical protein
MFRVWVSWCIGEGAVLRVEGPKMRVEASGFRGQCSVFSAQVQESRTV